MAVMGLVCDYYSIDNVISVIAALMMSSLKAQDVAYSPASIKRTVGNTATPLGSHDAFSVGHGVIQVYTFLSTCVGMMCGPRC
jgi:hypothetical protein